MDSFMQRVTRIWQAMNSGRKSWDEAIGWPGKIGGFIWLVGVVVAQNKPILLVLCGMFGAFVVEQMRLITISQKDEQ